MKKAVVITSVASMVDQFLMSDIKLLKELGYQVDVACNFEKGSTCGDERIKKLKDNLKMMNVRIFQVDFSRNVTKLKENFQAYKQVKNIISENNYNLIHCHSPIGGLITRIVSKMVNGNKTKVIYTAHGFHFFKGAPKVNWLIYFPVEWVCSFITDTLITINKEDYNFAVKYMHAKEILYVPGVGIDAKSKQIISVDRAVKRAELGIEEDEMVVISVGELNENKNHETVIRALSEVKNKNVVYIICGKGDKKEYLEQLAEELGVRLILLGFRDDVAEIYKCSDICAFPSKREGLSLALMEAMAAGCPIVCSKIRGNVDLIKDGEGGLLCSPESPKEFSDAIEKLLKDKALMDKMSEVNRRNSEKYDVSVIKEEMRKIYKL